MNHATRRPIYQEIEAERGSKVLAFVTGDRPGWQTHIAGDAVEPFVEILDAIGPTKKFSLILDTNGGQTSAAWRLINLIRTFCDELEIVVPSKAMSAGTLMALGADSILMTKQAALGPIDPTLDGHPLAPTVMLPTGQQVRMGISAEAVRGYIDEVKKDITDPNALATIWTQLSAHIHPVVLGEIFRLGEQIRSLASDLIVNQVSDAATQQKIIQLLCSDSGSHDYTINRRQAAAMGLNVEKPSADLYGRLTRVRQSFTAELKTLEPYSPHALLAGNAAADYTLIRGLVESADADYGFVSAGRLTVMPPDGNITDNRVFEGWRKLT